MSECDMIGRRVKCTPEGYLKGLDQPGDYGRATSKWTKQYPQQSWWNVIAPDGSSCSLNPDIHTVTEHEDGTITVSPSIVTATWHGWLQRGIWRSV
jgi:hypothetical protein